MSKEEVASIGARLKQIRTHLGIKQNTMADTLGISAAHLSEIENGIGKRQHQHPVSVFLPV